MNKSGRSVLIDERSAAILAALSRLEGRAKTTIMARALEAYASRSEEYGCSLEPPKGSTKA